MTATLTASGRDLRTLAGIVSEDRGEPPAHGLAPSLLDDLLGLIRCDFLSFVGLDTAQQADLFGQAAPLEPGDDWQETEEDIAPFWQHYWDTPCCSYPDRARDLRSITKSRISPSGTARCLPCFVPTCTRPTWTRSADAGAHRSSPPGTGNCCTWLPPGTPTARSPVG